VRCFNVERESELLALSSVATAEAKRAAVSLRVNPDIDAKTHPYISTGLRGNKFGIAHERAVAVYRQAASLPGIEVVGIDCHIGSQVTDSAPYLAALERLLDPTTFVRVHRSAIINLDRLKEIVSDSSGDGVIVLGDGTRVRLARSRRATVDRLLGRPF